MKSRRLTQVDVAKLAGVSQAAVFQVLNCNDSTSNVILMGKEVKRNKFLYCFSEE